MNRDKVQLLFEKIEEYDTIIIARHVRPDGDALGSALAMKRIINLNYPEKTVYLSGDDDAPSLSFLGAHYDTIPENAWENALGIALDTGNVERLSGKEVLLCKEKFKVDHHLGENVYTDHEWIESWRSSTCEMLGDMCMNLGHRLKVDKETATLLYVGMVTDSGRFLFSSTTGDTLRIAGYLLDKGVDIESVLSRINMKSYDYFRYQAAIFGRIKITENGVAYLFLDQKTQKEWNLDREAASDSLNCMAGIRGAICWIAFIENEDGSLRTRLRSRFMTINDVAEKYHGGGHDRASGATCYSMEEMEALLRDADEKTGEYKRTHGGWI